MSFDLAAVAASPLADQLTWIHARSKRDMLALWDEAGPITTAHFHGAEGEVIQHEGQNDLPPGFNHFAKPMVLRDGRIQGYNEGTWRWAIGPGHFFLKADDTGVYVDYTDVPTVAPGEFPPIRSNMAGLSRFVYGGTKDYMRRLTERIAIGRAYSASGEDRAHLFLLCRK